MTEAAFARDIDQSILQAKTLGYTPSTFKKMIAAHGPLGAAQRLLLTTEVSEGFYTLVRLKRVDLSLEAVVLKHHSLFTPQEISVAQQRLEESRTWSEADFS